MTGGARPLPARVPEGPSQSPQLGGPTFSLKSRHRPADKGHMTNEKLLQAAREAGPRVRLNHLAEHLGVTVATMRRHAKRLEAEGLVVLELLTTEQRTLALHLTIR